MLKENFINPIILFFFGILIIYLLNKPPTVIIKQPKIDTMDNINYLVENDMLSHAEFCHN